MWVTYDKKDELDWQNETAYANFVNMHDHCVDKNWASWCGRKERKSMNQNHTVTDIIPFINKAWIQSFAQVKKKNQMILETMIPVKNREQLFSDSMDISTPYLKWNSSDSTIITLSSRPNQQPSPNFNHDTSSFCLNSIVSSNGL